MTDPSSPIQTPFISTDWLAAHLADADLQVVDGSWYLPAQNRNARQEFEDGHIPGAVFFDIDALSDPASGLPHMLLDADAFGRAAGTLGLSSDSTLVVYDGAGLFSAPRVWWSLRLFGAKQVKILGGGLPRWTSEGRVLERGPSRATSATFHAIQAPGKVADLATVRKALVMGQEQIVDVRPAPRFRGEVAEPRAGVRVGHMPGSRNLPFTDLISDGELKSSADLRQSFEAAGVDVEKPIIASCGSGVTAAIAVLALETLGHGGVRLYDGSWTDYGSRAELPVATGAETTGLRE